MFGVVVSMGRIQDGFPRDCFELLREISQSEAGTCADRALVWGFLTQNHLEESRLPHTVRPHEADAGLGSQMCARAIEQDLGRKLFVDRFNLYHGALNSELRRGDSVLRVGPWPACALPSRWR